MVKNPTKISSKIPSNLLWADFSTTGDCDYSQLGIHVIAGDKITDCLGTITIRHIPTNTLVGSWTFN